LSIAMADASLASSVSPEHELLTARLEPPSEMRVKRQDGGM